jgi:hypothetical protein
MRVWMWKERDLPTLGGTSETVLVPRSPIKHTVSMVPMMYKFTQQWLPVLYAETRGVSYIFIFHRYKHIVIVQWFLVLLYKGAEPSQDKKLRVWHFPAVGRDFNPVASAVISASAEKNGGNMLGTLW